MSFQPAADPIPGDRYSCSAIETVVVPRSSDLGGFEVRRALPSRGIKTIGPFIFFDQMGPAEFLLGRGIDVRPHPHIGLATVTYLFTGEILHRDSLGTELAIQPGAVNWMTAGRGIAHSERTPQELRSGRSSLFGIQSWVALPRDREEDAPAFVHHEPDVLPLIADRGKKVRLIAGALYGQRSPVATASETVYADVALSSRRIAAARPGFRGARHLHHLGRDRRRRRPFCRAAAHRVPAGRQDHADGDQRRAPDDFGRRADGRRALHLVEFRVVAAGAD